jgi:hypothetical protein
MNKKVTIILAIVGLLAVGGGALAYTNNQNNKKEQEKMAMEKDAEAAAMMKKEEAAAMEKEKMDKEASMTPDEKMAMEKDEAMKKQDAMAKSGSYVTLADYNKDTTKYADTKKVYFFHASWCPICQGIDKEITTDPSKIPAGVTIIKTDFDSSTDLRKKYGVTTQYTFVQVDNNGNETAQWSATSLAKAIEGIES